MKVDLHIHTIYSDGVFSPEKIVDTAIDAGLSAIAITDHDNVLAYPIAVNYAQKIAKEKARSVPQTDQAFRLRQTPRRPPLPGGPGPRPCRYRFQKNTAESLSASRDQLKGFCSVFIILSPTAFVQKIFGEAGGIFSRRKSGQSVRMALG